jgi:hypothetical protein
MDMRPLSFSTPKLHVYFLDLAARKLSFNSEIKANQTEDNADRLAIVARRLHAERIDNVLQDKPGAAHRIDIDLIVRSMRHIHNRAVYSTKRRRVRWTSSRTGCGHISRRMPIPLI